MIINEQLQYSYFIWNLKITYPLAKNGQLCAPKDPDIECTAFLHVPV